MSGVEILRYDHVGLRVTDAARSLAFYAELGFRLDSAHSTDTAAEIVNAHGVRLNLILNGVPTPGCDNVLLDRVEKWPGYTHAAFVVDRLTLVLQWASARGVAITEGPVDWGRRITCFLRDPDGNVLEFNELKAEARYTLVIGQKNYSSWSMRAWLMMRHLGIDFVEREVALYTAHSRDEVRRLGGETGLVPVLKLGATAIWDTLAIFEYLDEAHGRVWPADPVSRDLARSLCAEVHGGFHALRAAMPMNIRARGRIAVRTAEVEADIARVAEIWVRHSGKAGPWLCGDFGAADIVFAPVATRFRTYGVALDRPAAAYCDALLAHRLVDAWAGLGAVETDRIEVLETGEAI